MRRGGPFSLRSDGGVDARLTWVEANALLGVADDMLARLQSPDDPVLMRLFPEASKEDEKLAAEFARLTHDDLLEQKKEAARALQRVVREGTRKRDLWRATLSADDARLWLIALNDARLVLGTKLKVTEDTDHRPLPASHPDAADHNMYVYLSALEDQLVEALIAGLPVSGTD